MNPFQLIKQAATPVAKTIFPRIYWRRKFNFLERNFGEVELHFLPYVCDSQKTSVDVGAARGIYTVHMLNFSKDCIAFEPRVSHAVDLRIMLKNVKNNANVETMGLSDKTGEASLKIPLKDPGRSTIEQANILENSGNITEVKIKIRKLDDYELRNVGFIKIDVEGHEFAVLNGAKETIEKNLPSFLIEIENRHRENAINNVTNFLTSRGYSGFFILDGKVTSISKFEPSVHQNGNNIISWSNECLKKDIYINNFFFIPFNKLEKFIQETKNLHIN